MYRYITWAANNHQHTISLSDNEARRMIIRAGGNDDDMAHLRDHPREYYALQHGYIQYVEIDRD